MSREPMGACHGMARGVRRSEVRTVVTVARARCLCLGTVASARFLAAGLFEVARFASLI
jgi:hypothetical protein